MADKDKQETSTGKMGGLPGMSGKLRKDLKDLKRAFGRKKKTFKNPMKTLTYKRT